MADPWTVMGLSRGATQEEVRMARGLCSGALPVLDPSIHNRRRHEQ